MTEPDEALLWAREDAAQQCEKYGLMPGVDFPAEYRAGLMDVNLDDPVRGYRAGAAASAERIKELEVRVVELEAALREVAGDLEAEIKARAGNDHPRRVERDLEPVWKARALLKEDDQ